MTQEEKAKAYDEALERAKKFKEKYGGGYAGYIFPELEESEDERVRKYLIEELKAAKSVGELKFIIPQPTREECIAYLEKQKDLDKMIVVSPEVWDKAIADAYENGKKDDEKQKEQKEQNWTPTEGEMGVLYKLCYISNQITDEDDTELTRLYQDLKREYFNGHSFENMFSNEKQKEQKGLNVTDFCQPINPDIAKVLPDVINELTWGDDEQKEQKPVKPSGKLSRQDYLYQLLIDQLITYSDYEYLIGQKSAEWSEKYIADVFERVGLAKIVREQGNDALTNAVQSAMIELSKVGNAEWSEEDERMRSNILNVLTSTRVYTLGSHGTSVYKYNNEIEWLKSLSSNLKKKNEDVAKLCSNEWSEEDEKRVKQLIYDTEAIRAGYEKRKESLGDDFNDELIKDCDEQINWLKSLRPSWKPSEDDIKMLEHIIGQYETGNKNSKVMGYLPRVEELDFLKKVLAKWKNLL